MDSGELRLEGRRLADRYLLKEELASGGMGSLWLALDEVLGRQVAVKVLHDRLARNEDLLERFRIEAVAAARLSHPAVVRVFDTGTSDGVCFIVMELVEGQTVAELLKEKGALSPAAAVTIVRGVLHALAHAHREGVIHRDVKPGNILVGSGDRVKLADFGIAKAAFANEDLTTTGNMLGTSRYVSPEQVTGGELDERSDLYAAGVVMYEVLTGRPPFDAETHIATATMRLTTDPPPPRSLRPGISRGLEAIVMKALARDPDNRFQSAEEMNAALERVAPDLGGPRGTAVPLVLRRRSFMHSWAAIPIILAIVAGLAVGVFLFLEGSGGEEAPDSPGNATAGGEPLELANAYSYDPSPGDTEEHDEALPLAIDGDPTSYWATEGYNTEDLGGIKEGVGLVLELENDEPVGGIEIQTGLPGWEFSVFPGDVVGAFDTASPLGDSFVAGEVGRYPIESVETRYVLIWITRLVLDDQGDHRALVNEIELLSPDG